MSEEFARDVAGWLRPATTTMSVETLETRVAAVSALAALDVTQGMVAAAFGIVTEEGKLRIEEALAAADPTYVHGTADKLVRCVAGAAVMAMLRTRGNSSIGAAQLVGSARFLGLEEEVPGIAEEAEAVLDDAAVSGRGRAPLKIAPGRRLAAPTPEKEVSASDLVSANNANVKRIDDYVADLEVRIQKMDEEINTLWWSRFARNSDGEDWTSVAPEVRAVTAAIELDGLLSFDPPSAGSIAVLRDAVSLADQKADLLKLGQILSAAGVQSLGAGPLLPLSSAANRVAEFAGDLKTAGGVLKRDGFDPKRSVPLTEVPEQVLRELALRDVG